VVVHAVGGWIALPAVLLLGARRGRYTKDGNVAATRPPTSPSWPWAPGSSPWAGSAST
jgi:Amt family ammonium transporter